tara:strand:- start:5214 stop:5708 length:495 start_codon:yes stop_codon:yes gene_type:complete
MKFPIAFFTLLALITYAAYSSADLDVALDVSIGSEVGPNTSGAEVVPFWGGVRVGYDTGVVKPFLEYSHTSSVDVNGDGYTSYDGEAYGVGVEAVYKLLYVSASVSKFANNDLERETTPVQSYEVGLSDDFRGIPLRVGVFYQNTSSGYLERLGVKVGYSFDIY